MKKIIPWLIIVILSAVIIAGFVYFKNYNNTLRIQMLPEESSDDKSTLEYDFDFRNGKCYRLTSIATTPSSDVKVKRYKAAEKKLFNKNNNLYEGYVSKVWFSKDKIMTYEVFDFNLLNESEMDKLYVSGFKGKTKKQIIDSIEVYNGENKDASIIID